jgi:hypothetical protein
VQELEDGAADEDVEVADVEEGAEEDEAERVIVVKDDVVTVV